MRTPETDPELKDVLRSLPKSSRQDLARFLKLEALTDESGEGTFREIWSAIQAKKERQAIPT